MLLNGCSMVVQWLFMPSGDWKEDLLLAPKGRNMSEKSAQDFFHQAPEGRNKY
jgi:hypothetical protein